jgi:hypothetical protein
LTTLLDDDDKNQIQQDLSSARAKMGLAANLHYVWPGRNSTQSTLSHHHQIKALLKEDSCFDDRMELDDTINDRGEIYDLYQYLEQSGSHYISLLEGVVPEVCGASPSDSPCTNTVLFNETWLGDTLKGQGDGDVAADEEQDMLHVVSDILPIADSQEIMTGIAYAMPYEVRQFQLFHVCMHIDATADSNKEGHPLVIVSSKDACSNMFIIYVAFFFLMNRVLGHANNGSFKPFSQLFLGKK